MTASESSQTQLRQSVRRFLAEHAPDDRSLPSELGARLEVLRRFQKACQSAGYIGRSWPTEFGGAGGSTDEQLWIDEEFALAGVPQFAGVIGLMVLGPALLEFGTEEQKARYLPKILSADELWCQGFSEPGAGSDLGSLRTHATVDGDDYIVSGQKTWTSWAQFASFCGLLVRTEPDQPKHKGISMLIVDMSSPGITVSPMEQLTGHREFSEVFFDEVRVPRTQLLGAPGQGWEIAMHAFGHERGTAAMRAQVRLAGLHQQLVEDVQRRGPDFATRDVRRALGRSLIDIEVLRMHATRAVSGHIAGGEVGFESSTVKLLRNRAEQRLMTTALDLLASGWTSPDSAAERAAWTERYLQSRPVSVYGGTEQIQRNIIASRILKLPRE